MAKNKNINIRVSDEEFDKIKSSADSEGLNVSQYLLQSEHRTHSGIKPEILVNLESALSTLNETCNVPDDVKSAIRKEVNALWSLLSS